MDLQGKWDQKQNINLVKISKRLTLFHKPREDLDEIDSNPQSKREFLFKKTLKKTLFQSEKARASPVS